MTTADDSFLDGFWQDSAARAKIRRKIEAVRAESSLPLEKFGDHSNWSLQYVAKVYADDDKPEVDHWAVFEERGSVNDREWTEIGAGATPHEAISSALRAAPQAPPQRSGDGTNGEAKR